MVDWLEAHFPGLRTTTYRITSPRSGEYNCVAWAAGDTLRWWWPHPDLRNDAHHWPEGIACEETLEAFLAAFATLGYIVSDSEAEEPGFEKVALFADAQGVPTHAARHLSGRCWTSKLGVREDIEHDLRALEGEIYGVVARVLKRTAARS